MKVAGVTVDLDGTGSSGLSPLWSGKVGAIIISDQTACVCVSVCKVVCVCVCVCVIVCITCTPINVM